MIKNSRYYFIIINKDIRKDIPNYFHIRTTTRRLHRYYTSAPDKTDRPPL